MTLKRINYEYELHKEGSREERGGRNYHYLYLRHFCDYSTICIKFSSEGYVSLFTLKMNSQQGNRNTQLPFYIFFYLLFHIIILRRNNFFPYSHHPRLSFDILVISRIIVIRNMTSIINISDIVMIIIIILNLSLASSSVTKM